MERRIHLFIHRCNPMVWLMTLFSAASIVFRIYLALIPDSGVQEHFWSFFMLPSSATVLFVGIVLLNGKECFYKTALPVWMMVLYCAIWTAQNIPGKITIWLFWIALAFFALVYTEISSGLRKSVWLLPVLVAAALGTVFIFHKQAFALRKWDEIRTLLPDILALFGCACAALAVRVHPAGEYHRTWGDRSDGRKIRTLAPMDQVSPYIMVNRNTATNSFEESFEISSVDRYIRQKRREGLTNFGIMHVFLACYCRTLAKYPGLNRFISGQKVYTRGEDIQFCLTIKKEMSTSAPETIVKVHLSPRDSAYDVYRKVNTEIEKAKDSPLDSGFDNTAHALMLVPGVVLKFVVWVLKTMDYFGLLPSFLLEVSPFHGSIFFTSMGSLGIPPIYHHLYDFGNLPVFGAFGCKRRAVEVQEDGTLVQKKYVDFKFSLDERIVDGFYYAAFFKHYKRIIAHPELLDNPPDEVIADID